MNVKKTEHFYIKDNGVISKMCHLSKNLYNQVIYILRNQSLNHEKLTGYKMRVKQFTPSFDTERMVGHICEVLT